MIALERQFPYKLLALEALLRRLDIYDEDYVFYSNLYTSMRVGFEGESLVDNEWVELEIPVEYSLFHNYETENEFSKSHQIDTIFLSKHFIWLLEIKNMSGRLEIEDEKHQFTRTKSDGTSDSFYNPIDQIERHSRFIIRTLKSWGIFLPVEKAIVIVKDSSIIGEIPKTASVFHMSGLQSKLNKLIQKYPKASISDSHYKIIQSRLLELYKQKIWKPNLENKRIRKGVLCRNCDYKKEMKFEHGAFICQTCRYKSKDVILEALQDYKYLFSEWISNSEMREFFGVKSRYAVARLLKELNLEWEGTFRDRRYKINNILDKNDNRT